MSAGAKIFAMAASLLCGCTVTHYAGTLELVAVEAPSAAIAPVGELAVVEHCPPDYPYLSRFVEGALAQYPDAQALADVEISLGWNCLRLEGVPVRSGGPGARLDPSEENEPDSAAKEQP